MRMRGYVSVCLYLRVWLSLSECVRIRVYLCLCVRMRVCENVCYVCLCEDALLCVSVHVHSYRTHTHTHAHTHRSLGPRTVILGLSTLCCDLHIYRELNP